MTSTCETKKFGTGEVTSCDVFQNAGTEIYLVSTVLLPLARNRLSLNKKKNPIPVLTLQFKLAFISGCCCLPKLFN